MSLEPNYTYTMRNEKVILIVSNIEYTNNSKNKKLVKIIFSLKRHPIYGNISKIY